MGRVQELLWDLAEEHHGVVTSRAAAAMGVRRTELVKLAQRGWLVRVGHGVYRLPKLAGTQWDELAEAVAGFGGRGVLSHSTALLIHEIADVNPNKIHITLPASYRPRGKKPSAVALHKGKLTDKDVEIFEGLSVVKPALAIQQCIEEENVPFHLLRQATKNSLKKGRITEAQGVFLNARLDGGDL
ncbi:MAG: type IV toxin-antitoxin system AbiEi family antitoxin domain-containing protein [Actinomycetota bacterium]